MEQEEDTNKEDRDELVSSVKKLEDAWMKKAESQLKNFLVSPLHDAAAKGNLEKIQELISEGVSINEVDSASNTALHWASGAGRLNVVEWLINQEASLNAQNLLGDTALHRVIS
eukprot:TRINITY_DN904_c0_g1_i1.p1 TRINITY_DN904_c0_g1~~TRINITY_DN904_c0_g1_i1.p1  ORF type:complete len:114 (+),score=29.66 TRINITY_DN904_c0_g1_i1:91-432(+)